MNHLALKIRRTGPSARLALVTILASLAAGATLLAFADDSVQPRFIPKQGWTQGGYDASNNRHQPWQTRLGPKTAYRLQLKWSQTLHGDVSATPAVVGRHVYVPDWGGYLSKLDKYTGRVIWQKRLDSYAGEAAGAVSRTSPAYADGMLFIGDLSGGNVLAISAGTGELRWRVTISKGPAAQVTQSLLVQGGKVYAGVSSNEVMMASDPKYHCCVFQGSVSALDARSGRILWTTKMAPDNGGMPGGYSGVSVWGSTPVLDEETNTLYITTGNNYALPFTVKECELKGGKDCQDRRNLVDAIVALDSRSGALKWATGTREFDDWNGGCFTGPPGVGNCPLQPGPDHDFGSGVNLFSIKDARGRFRRVVGAGQKSGIYWLIDAVNGKILWARQVVPGSSLGGLMWGTATDGKRIYMAGADKDRLPYVPKGAPEAVTAGSFAALDPLTGEILWQTVDPAGHPLTFGAVTVTNGIVLGGSMSGDMYAFDAATGELQWRYAGAGSSNAGPAVDEDGTVYWGNGYDRFGMGRGSFTFYAFSVDGK